MLATGSDSRTISTRCASATSSKDHGARATRKDESLCPP